MFVTLLSEASSEYAERLVASIRGEEGQQIFFRSDIKKIVVFDDNPAVFAQIPSPAPTPSSLPKKQAKKNKPKKDLINVCCWTRRFNEGCVGCK